jgi:hypothetical protein
VDKLLAALVASQLAAATVSRLIAAGVPIDPQLQDPRFTQAMQEVMQIANSWYAWLVDKALPAWPATKASLADLLQPASLGPLGPLLQGHLSQLVAGHPMAPGGPAPRTS